MRLIINLIAVVLILSSCSETTDFPEERAIEITATYDYKKYSTEELKLYFQDEALQTILIFYMPKQDLDGNFSTFAEFPDMCNNLSIANESEGYEVTSPNIHFYISYDIDSQTHKIKSFKRKYL